MRARQRPLGDVDETIGSHIVARAHITDQVELAVLTDLARDAHLASGDRTCGPPWTTATPSRPPGLQFIKNLQPPTIGHIAKALLRALVVALLLGMAPAPAGAAPLLGWSAPTMFDASGTPTAVSCASESLCVAVDHQGDAFSVSDPTAPTPSWSPPAAIDPGGSLSAVSCASDGPCVAVDDHGYAFVELQPGSSSWSAAASIDGGTALTGVSCPSASLCVAVDEAGDVLMSENLRSGDWTHAGIDPGHRLLAVSCSSPSLCVAVDNAGEAWTSIHPTEEAWRPQRIDFGELTAVSCFAAQTCLAGDSAGDGLASADLTAATPTWNLTSIDGDERLTGVSCASSGLCVAVDDRGEALTSDDPATPTPSWSAASVDLEPLASVSCLPGGFCMAVDTAGRSLAARVPAPTATTLAPTEVTSAGAIVAGAVNPNDAMLETCRFEYGSALPYTQSAPCSALPAATGGTQDVSALLSGLAPNTTYHYRILASSPAGTSGGGDETFTTAVSSQVALVYPRPSITGTPAANQLLTCHPGTPTGTTAQLTYAWLRDLIPIPGSAGSTYTVKYQDSGHHLQCQVTATDGGGSATAKSAFVTIPVGGAPASAGETVIGKAAFRNGKLGVPIACSPHAAEGCQIRLRLTVTETLSGKRVVAVAARSKPDAHESAAVLHHLTVTLASVHARLAPDTHRTLSAPLSAIGRRLLGSARHLIAYLYVSGTVIGVIESQLARQLVALSASSTSASTHAARQR